MVEKYKDHVINDVTYRIKPVSATVGNWIINAMPSSRTDEAVFQSIQGHILSKIDRVKEVENGTPAQFPIFKRPDTWLVPDLATDFVTVSELYEEAIKFNFDSFFEKLKKRLNESGVEL